MDLTAILGLIIVIALVWWALGQFSGQLPPLIVTICYVVLVIVAVVVLCNILGIPLPLRVGR
jgi:hypothetical protein